MKVYGSRWLPLETNFRHLVEAIGRDAVGHIDGVLFDLGFSSDELADPTKGLSFMEEGPLDMRLGPCANDDGLTAAYILQHWSERELRKMLEVFGEERYARTLAHAMVEHRKKASLEKTGQLVQLIRDTVPAGYEHGRLHPATRTFQALRIAVNDELESLKEGIEGAHEVLRPGGRCAIISFHSLEDRIVKRAFRSQAWSTLHKKPITPKDQEMEDNPRARSAKLRAAEKR